MTRAKAAIPDGWLQNVVTAKISIGNSDILHDLSDCFLEKGFMLIWRLCKHPAQSQSRLQSDGGSGYVSRFLHRIVEHVNRSAPPQYVCRCSGGNSLNILSASPVANEVWGK
jgi:hypothetical protein